VKDREVVVKGKVVPVLNMKEYGGVDVDKW
jgi:hypothetical protein